MGSRRSTSQWLTSSSAVLHWIVQFLLFFKIVVAVVVVPVAWEKRERERERCSAISHFSSGAGRIRWHAAPMPTSWPSPPAAWRPWSTRVNANYRNCVSFLLFAPPPAAAAVFIGSVVASASSFQRLDFFFLAFMCLYSYSIRFAFRNAALPGGHYLKQWSDKSVQHAFTEIQRIQIQKMKGRIETKEKEKEEEEKGNVAGALPWQRLVTPSVIARFR